jgi:hypothetical protein
VAAGILLGAVKSKSSSDPPPAAAPPPPPPNGSISSLRVSKTRAKPSLVNVLSAFSRTPLSISAFSSNCPKFDLPSISLRTFIRSFESDADFWLTCVMPFAVFVKTVVRSIQLPAVVFRRLSGRQ